MTWLCRLEAVCSRSGSFSPETAVAVTGHSSSCDTTDRRAFSRCHLENMGRTMFPTTSTGQSDRLFATL